ncbi:hypothetical protein FGO68_gene2129 [Halteria grandinella]|uniref:MORN repeat protein n=1 Tax=Halteria grandinella TaxID=5974 RepID=A0A8J8T294_HALGN|nr:hypothetical protein FGO68_gene2129 [Halteria grandinella]
MSNLTNGIYYGQMLNGKRDGYGLLYAVSSSKDPQIYYCQWSSGIPIMGRWTGAGDKVWNAYEGTFSERFLAEGDGVYTEINGFEYTGQFQSGTRSGNGISKWEHGEYKGQWRDNKKNGQGEQKWYKSGNILRGTFADDEFVEGVNYINGTQCKLEGKFVKEELQGIGKYTYLEGEFQIGEWHEGNKTGEHKVYSKEGKQTWYAYYIEDKVEKLVEIL